MSSSLARATFTRMQDGTAEEHALIHARESAFAPAVREVFSREPVFR